MAQQQNPQKNQGNQQKAKDEIKSMDEEQMIEVEIQEDQQGDLMMEILGDEDERKSSMKSQKMDAESSKGQFANLSSDNYEKKELQVNNQMIMYPESSSSSSSRQVNQTRQGQILQQQLETRQQNVFNVTQEEDRRRGRDYSHLDRCGCRTENQPCSNQNFCACIYNRRKCTSLCRCQLFGCTNPNQEMLQQRIAIIQYTEQRQHQGHDFMGIEGAQNSELYFIQFNFFWVNQNNKDDQMQEQNQVELQKNEDSDKMDEGTEDKIQEQYDEEKSEKKKKQSKK